MNNKTSSNASTIGYRGRVNIRLVCNNTSIEEYEQHNEGLPLLFSSLCDFLAGNKNSLRPTHIALFNTGNKDIQITDESVNKHRCSRFLPVTSTFVKEDQNKQPCCRYEVSIPLDEISRINDEDLTQKTVNCLALFAQPALNSYEAMAYFKLGQVLTLGAGANYAASLLIRWDLSFGNLTEQAT